MNRLKTPFGEIDIQIDGKSIKYISQKGSSNDVLWPDVKNRYQIVVNFNPDGRKHSISCVFLSECSFKTSPESGERLECYSFYNDSRFKLSIGIECEESYISNVYDYDADYLDNGMAYLIRANTKTKQYVFGIAWIDDVGWDDPVDNEHKRDVQTWFAADPTYAL